MYLQGNQQGVVKLYNENDNVIPIIKDYIVSVKINGQETNSYHLTSYNNGLQIYGGGPAQVVLYVDGFYVSWYGYINANL